MSDNFLGEIRLFPYGVIPRGWLACNGQTLSISQYAAVYALLGTQFGGDGKSNFCLPDLRGRVGLGVSQGTGPAVAYPMGQSGGQQEVPLPVSSLPAHNHPFNCAANTPATLNNPSGALLAQASSGSTLYATDLSALVSLIPASIGSQGAGVPHENRQPSLALNFCIAVAGIWPSRP